LRKPPVILIASILALVLFAAGCGGDDDSGASGATGTETAANPESGGDSDDAVASDPAENEAFQEEANAVCLKSGSKARAAILRAYDTPRLKKASTEAEGIQLEVSLFVPILITDAEARVKGISALEPPSGEEAQVQEILDSYRAWIDKASGTPLKIVIANDVYNEARELSGKFPLVKCGLSPFEEPTG
jgi:hypothetical protein